MPDTNATGTDVGWIATIGTILGLAALKLIHVVFIPWFRSWNPRKSKGVEIEGYGHEIVLKGHPNFTTRENGQPFSFEIPEGEMTARPGGFALKVELVNIHIDGQRTTATCQATGVVAGNFSFMIYTTIEHPPWRGKWTGCGIFRLSANGESVGIWITEDIYEPGRYMVGNVRVWPKGLNRRPTSSKEYRTPLPE